MSKLDNIILKYGNAVLDLPVTNDPIGKPVDEAKQEVQMLVMEIYSKSLEGHSIAEMGDIFRKEVKSL